MPKQSQLCLENMGFDSRYLHSKGIDEIRPYMKLDENKVISEKADGSEFSGNVITEESPDLNLSELASEEAIDEPIDVTAKQPVEKGEPDEVWSYNTSYRLLRMYQANTSNLQIPDKTLWDELQVIGSIEQPVFLESEKKASAPHGEGEGNDTKQVRGSGRGLISYCYRQNYLNATVRKGEKSGYEAYPSLPGINNLSEAVGTKGKYEFAPGDSYGTHYYSIVDICKKLSRFILPFSNGIIVIAGGTGSGKSQITRGIIDRFLHECLKEKQTHPKKRIHFLTIENPIEKYLVLDTKGEPLDPNELAELTGLDYTPRQVPEDTPSLEQALMRDALRQTPTLTYVGEVREPHEFRTVLDFAETGQPVITTMHAGSLREAFQRLLAASGALTPAARAQVASRIRAVIHLQELQSVLHGTVQDKKTRKKTDTPLKVGLPCLWINTPNAVSNLVADGLSSLVPVSSLEASNAYCYGRTAFLTQHKHSYIQLKSPREWVAVRQEAVALDLGRRRPHR